MTACAAIFNLGGEPADERLLRAMLEEMAYRGPQGTHAWASGEIALGLRELCVLPEDKGVQWPVWDRDKQACIVFDGRLDNREEIIAQLRGRSALSGTPDAKLALLAYLKWGRDSFAKLLGEFAFVIFEPARKTLTAVRDPMGCRRLCCTQAGATVLLASEEQALLSHPGVPTKVNERHVVAHLAVGGQTAGETYFQDIFDLLPGHWMRVNSRGISRGQYWRLPRTREHWKLKPDEVHELYREKLFAAVKSRLRGQTPAAVLLSGGLDSSSLIAAAARIAPGEEHKPLAVSWVFDRFTECDERRYAQETCDLLRVPWLQVVCDDYWPLYDRQRYTHYALHEINLDFNGTRWASFDRIRDQGLQVVLSGSGGDELFIGHNYWLHDLFAAGQIRPAARALGRRLSSQPPGRWIRDPVLRRLLPFNGIRRRRILEREWLTGAAMKILPAEPRADPLTGRRWGFDRFEGCISPWKARDISVAHADAQRWALDVREPFRDLRLVEFALNLPALYCYDHLGNRERPLPRDAMRQLLPAAVLERPQKTSFSALFFHGIRVGAGDRVRQLLTRSEAVWPDYVDQRWLLRGLDAPHEAPAYARVLWGCLCLELWMDALRGKKLLRG